MGWEKKMERARRLHRPSLKNWECDGLYEIFPNFVKGVLEEDSYQSYSVVTQGAASEALPVVLDAKDLSQVEFADRYEAKEVPSILINIPEGHDASLSSQEGGGKGENKWPALKKWRLDKLEDDDDLRDRYFKCGEDDNGKSIKM